MGEETNSADKNSNNSELLSIERMEQLFEKVYKEIEETKRPFGHYSAWEKYVTDKQAELVLQDKCPFCESELKEETLVCSDFGRKFSAAQQGHNECKKCNFSIGWLWVDTFGHYLLGPEHKHISLHMDPGELAEKIEESINPKINGDSKEAEEARKAAEAVKHYQKMHRDRDTARSVIADCLMNKYFNWVLERSNKKKMPKPEANMGRGVTKQATRLK